MVAMSDPSFEVVSSVDLPAGGPLLVGIADVGVAGLTAADYLVAQSDATEVGYVRTRGIPDITPFSDGVPRHPIRVYRLPNDGLTVLLSEVFVPPGVTDSLADTLSEWIDRRGFEDVTVLFGAPFPHSEGEHTVFRVATDGFDARRGDAIAPLAGGYFDGLVGELMTRSLVDELPPTGVLVTPTHLPGPDIDAALRLLDGVERLHDITVDEAELEERAAEMNEYYADLAQRVQALRNADQPFAPEEYPDDRMFM
jgi:uncharacterized protein